MQRKATGEKKIDRVRAIEIGREFMEEATKGTTDWLFAGSIRREVEMVGNIDIVCIRNDQILRYLVERFGFKKNGTPQTNGVVEGVQITLYLCSKKDWGAHLFMWTGPSSWNTKMRIRAESKKLILNQYGLWTLKQKLLGAKSEEKIMQLLDLAYVEPRDRE